MYGWSAWSTCSRLLMRLSFITLPFKRAQVPYPLCAFYALGTVTLLSIRLLSVLDLDMNRHLWFPLGRDLRPNANGSLYVSIFCGTEGFSSSRLPLRCPLILASEVLWVIGRAHHTGFVTSMLLVRILIARHILPPLRTTLS